MGARTGVVEVEATAWPVQPLVEVEVIKFPSESKLQVRASWPRLSPRYYERQRLKDDRWLEAQCTS